jgi:hypothetical protein
MFAPKKAIPKLVVGMLALTGCSDAAPGMPGGSGGDGGGAGGSGGMAGMGGSGGSGGMADDDLTIAARAWCMKILECYYNGIDGDASEACTNSQVYTYGDESGECQAAAISYFECVGEHEGCVDFRACDDYKGARDDACD